MRAPGNAFTRTGATVTSEGGAPRQDAYGAAFARAAGALAAHGAVIVAGSGTSAAKASVGGFAAHAAHAVPTSGPEAGYFGPLPLWRLPRLDTPQPWLAGTSAAGGAG